MRYRQELLGHRSTRTTQIYTRVSQRELDAIRSPLDRLMRTESREGGEERAIGVVYGAPGAGAARRLKRDVQEVARRGWAAGDETRGRAAGEA